MSQVGLADKELARHRSRKSNRQAKGFKLISPNGEIHIGSNLKEFCERMNLQSSNMSKVCRGLDKHYKGWTGSYINTKE